ncbi:MAG: hypothetical protein AB8B71_08195 [Paracoccaceae bacterium]
MSKIQPTALKIAAALWMIWGLVLTLAGVMTIIQAPSEGLSKRSELVDR